LFDARRRSKAKARAETQRRPAKRARR